MGHTSSTARPDVDVDDELELRADSLDNFHMLDTTVTEPADRCGTYPILSSSTESVMHEHKHALQLEIQDLCRM